MYCTNCGTKIDEGTGFCKNCGTKIISKPEQPEGQSIYDNPGKPSDEKKNEIPKDTQSDYVKTEESPDRKKALKLSNGKIQCPTCGTENPADMEVCYHCGQILVLEDLAESGQIRERKEKKYHPYQQLGGFLAFIVYGGIIASIIEIILSIISAVAVINLVRYFSQWGTPVSFVTILSLLAVIAVTVAYGLIIWLMLRIKNKDQTFLFFYHKLAIATLILLFIAQWLSNGILTAIISVLAYGLMYVLWTVYFVKSVRVRTYMGSDEYLRLDPFTKNIQSPRPADEE